MLCPKCNGVQDVIKIHNPDSLEARLCDVQCLDCGEIVYSQPYDWGNKINLVVTKDNGLKK